MVLTVVPAAQAPALPGSLRVLLAEGRREVRRLNDSVARFLWERRVPPNRLHDVQLVAEELVTNVLRHGLPETGRHQAAVEVGIEAVPCPNPQKRLTNRHFAVDEVG